MSVILKVPWTHSITSSESCKPLKTKCFSVQVASKVTSILKTETDLEVLDLSLVDEDDEVRMEAAISIPVIALWTGFDKLTQLFRRLA